jgi:hypothetical protein
MKVKRDETLVKTEWYCQTGVVASKLHWEIAAGRQLQIMK